MTTSPILYETLPSGEDIDFTLVGVGMLSNETSTLNGYATIVWSI